MCTHTHTCTYAFIYTHIHKRTRFPYPKPDHEHTNIWNFRQFFLILTFTAKKIRESVRKQRYVHSISPTWKPQNMLTYYANTQEHTQGHRGMRIQVWLPTPEGVWILLNGVEDTAKFYKLSRVGHYSYPWTLRNSVTPNHSSPAIFFLLTSNLPNYHKSPPHLPRLKNLSHNL